MLGYNPELLWLRQRQSHTLTTRLDLIHYYHRLNMELDLQSLVGLLCTSVFIGWGPATPPFPRIWAHIRGRLLVSQDRGHFLINPLITNFTSTLCFPWGIFSLDRHFSTYDRVEGRAVGELLGNDEPLEPPAASVADPDLGTSQRDGSGSFYHHAKIVRKTLIPTITWPFLTFYLWKIVLKY